MTAFNLAKYKHIVYGFDPITGYYSKTTQQPEPAPIQAMPPQLRREKTVCGHIMAEYSLFKRQYKANKSRSMFTGLQPCRARKGWFIGDNLRVIRGAAQKELLLIFITPENDRMHIFYFSGFYKLTDNLRQQFAAMCAPELENRIRSFEQKRGGQGPTPTFNLAM